MYRIRKKKSGKKEKRNLKVTSYDHANELVTPSKKNSNQCSSYRL